MKGLMLDVDSITAKLAPLYAEPALVPATAWLATKLPSRPTATLIASAATGERYVRMTPAAGDKAWLWLVRTLSGGQWTTTILPNEARSHRLSADGERVVVNLVDRVGNLSPSAIARSSKSPAAVANQP